MMAERTEIKINDKVRKNEDQQAEIEENLNVAMQLFDQLNNIRLVEKIARPSSIKTKIEEIDQFSRINDELQSLLVRIRKNMEEPKEPMNKQTTVKGKSMELGTTSSQYGQLKKSIKAIEGRYYEVFFEGSFKHYDRISKLLGISRGISSFDIEQWSHECQKLKRKGMDCCGCQ